MPHCWSFIFHPGIYRKWFALQAQGEKTPYSQFLFKGSRFSPITRSKLPFRHYVLFTETFLKKHWNAFRNVSPSFSIRLDRFPHKWPHFTPHFTPHWIPEMKFIIMLDYKATISFFLSFLLLFESNNTF